MKNFFDGLKAVAGSLPKWQVEALENTNTRVDAIQLIDLWHRRDEGSIELDYLYGLLNPVEISTAIINPALLN